MISTYSVGLCVFLNTILLLCQGYPRAGTDGLGFSYQEEQEQNAAYHNAMVSGFSHEPICLSVNALMVARFIRIQRFFLVSSLLS